MNKTTLRKKALALFLALVTALSVLTMTVNASDLPDGFRLLFYVTPEDYEGDAHAAVIGFEGTVPPKLEIPDSYDGKPVWEIADDAFRNCTTIETLVLPQELAWIDSGAFAGCENLKTIRFGECAREIGPFAFAGCKSLTSVDFKNVGSLGVSAFEDCSSLAQITLAASYIDRNAFCGCDRLEKVTITGYDHAHSAMFWDDVYTTSHWLEEGNEALMNAEWDRIHYNADDLCIRSNVVRAICRKDFTLTINYDLADTDTCYWYHIEDYAIVLRDDYLNQPSVACYCDEGGIHTVYSEVVDADGNVVYQEDFYVDVRYTFTQRLEKIVNVALRRLYVLLRQLMCTFFPNINVDYT